MKLLPLLFTIVVLICCNDMPSSIAVNNNEAVYDYTCPEEQVTASENWEKVFDIPLPSGFHRIDVEINSFAAYLGNFPLNVDKDKVHLFDGRLKARQDVHIAILDIDVGNRDLQQCADAVMRLRAEYLWEREEYDKIHFNFTSGHKASWVAYAKGKRPVVSGNNVIWRASANEDYSYQNFRKYLDLVFIYAGSASLEKELKTVHDISQIEAGDVWIKGGFPGHAVIVMDVAINEVSGEKIFLLAQSYMPAQDIHILKNPVKGVDYPWYYISEIEGELITPEWVFGRNELRRF